MIVQVELEGKKGLVKESDNLVDALKEFNPKKVKSVTYTEGDITTFAKPVKEVILSKSQVNTIIVQENLSMSNKKNKLQGYDTLVSTFVLLSKESKEEVLDKLDKMDKVQVKSTHYYKGQLVLDIEYDAYWASCWFDTSAGIREHTGINLSEVYEGTDPEYFNK